MPFANDYGPLIESYLFAVFSQKEYKTVLDVGCGHGHALEFLRANFGIKGTGIDIAKQHIKTAKRYYPEIEFVCKDVLKWKPRHEFDVVFSHGFFIHINHDNIERAIKKVMGFAKEGLFIESSAKEQKEKKVKYNAYRYWNHRAEHPTLRQTLPMKYYFSHDYMSLFKKLGFGVQLVKDFKVIMTTNKGKEDTKSRLYYVWRTV